MLMKASESLQAVMLANGGKEMYIIINPVMFGLVLIIVILP